MNLLFWVLNLVINFKDLKDVLISRLKAVVAGDEYLDDDFDDLDYASEDELNDSNDFKQNSRNSILLQIQIHLIFE